MIYNQPDFIVLGAPKCGTSSVHQYLRQHPGLYVPPVKEQHYFATDLIAKSHPSREEYYTLFASAGSDQVIGDVAVMYLFSEDAARNITDEIGRIKAIVLLRHPVDALHAFHAHMLWTNNEDITELALALQAEDDRRAGRNRPRNLHQHPRLLEYRKMFKYAEQLERAISYFGRENVQIQFQEDFQRDTAAEMARMFAFIGVNAAAEIDTKRHNVSRKVRSRFLQQVFFDRDSPVRRLAKALPLSKRVKRKLTHVGREINSTKAHRAAMSPELRQQLLDYYAADVAYVERITGRELDNWRQ